MLDFLYCLVSALYAYLIEGAHNILCGKEFFLLAGFVYDGFALVHHDQAVSVFYGVTQVVCYHDGCHFLFLYDLVGQLHDQICGLRIQCCRMLIQDQKLNGCHGGHQKCQGLALSAGQQPHRLPHPVIFIGKLISLLEKFFRRVLPKTQRGEWVAGGLIWIFTTAISFLVPWGILRLCGQVSPWLALAVQSIMCWQIIAPRSLRDESMKVYHALKTGTIQEARHAVSMIVGRDTDQLDEAAVARAAVETVAENTSDGVIAPLLFLALGGAPLGFFYKAVNTMDSMLGYVEPPYKNVGCIPAKLDDLFNFIPARLSAVLMLAAGALCGMNVKSGWKIFRRDRYNHASPNSAQTESVCAGLLGVRLAGDASYHGVLHKKKYIGDALREITPEDIPASCKLMYGTTVLMVVLCIAFRWVL